MHAYRRISLMQSSCRELALRSSRRTWKQLQLPLGPFTESEDHFLLIFPSALSYFVRFLQQTTRATRPFELNLIVNLRFLKLTTDWPEVMLKVTLFNAGSLQIECGYSRPNFWITCTCWEVKR